MVVIVEKWSKVKADPERRNLVVRLEAWAERFLITEDWMFEAAIDTLTDFFLRSGKSEKGKVKWFWRYTSRGFHPRFEPVLLNNFWYPPSTGGLLESWEQFKKRIEREVKRQLAAYRTIVDIRLGTGREKRLQHEAEWTARYQKGESVADIVQTINIGHLADPEQTTYRAIERFAKNIGLKLRRRGTRYRRTVQPST